MARKRMIDPGIWTDEGFIELSGEARLMFIGIISNADDEGRGLASTKSLKARIFPSDEITLATVDCIKHALACHTNIVFYTVDGVEYYQLLKWRDYQTVDHPKPSTYPGLEYATVEKNAPAEKKASDIPETPSLFDDPSSGDQSTVCDASTNDRGTIADASTKNPAGSQHASRQLTNQLTNKPTNAPRDRVMQRTTAGAYKNSPAVAVSTQEALAKMFQGFGFLSKAG
jgi:hypothetical protein